MSEPLQFKPKKPTHVFECACGCQLFYLLADSRVECRVCGHTNNTIRQGAIDAMADKFLGWPLPASVQSDTCVTMRPYQVPRYGTSLLNVEEARQMVDYLFASAPNPESKP